MAAFGVFVAGTDTGVGKTEVACGLLRAYAAAGLSTIGMKPVAAGCRRTAAGLRNGDVEALRAASTVRARRSLINPYAFAPPIAPHIAAARVGTPIDPDRIAAAFDRLAARSQVVVVEGVGGFRVPLGDGHGADDLAVRLGLPVILVVGLRLGCLNHALLTAEAVRARGLPLAGWVCNRIVPRMAARRENEAALEARLDAPLLARIDHTRGARRRAASIARALSAAPLPGLAPCVADATHKRV